MAVLREQRTDRLATAGIIAGLVSDLDDPVGRIDEALAAARECYLCKPAPKTKRTRHQRELIGRVVSILEEATKDIKQMVDRGIYPPKGVPDAE